MAIPSVFIKMSSGLGGSAEFYQTIKRSKHYHFSDCRQVKKGRQAKKNLLESQHYSDARIMTDKDAITADKPTKKTMD